MSEAMRDEELEERLGRAEEALDEGDPEAALAALAGLAANEPEVALLECEARLELSQLAAARAAWSRAAAELDAADADLVWLDAQLALREWRPEHAEERLATLIGGELEASAHRALALCRDLAGDHAGADEHLARAHALDPDANGLPVRLEPEAFDRELHAAFDELPADVRRSLGALRTFVEPMPDRSLAEFGDAEAVAPDLLGLFVGPTLAELGEAMSVPIVYVFQRNLERVARDEQELREEIRITLWHEIGHFLGHDEDGVEALGLG